VALGVLTCFDILCEGRYERSRTEEERFAARWLKSVDHLRTLLVLSLSCRRKRQ
jgi:hypothetical protein